MEDKEELQIKEDVALKDLREIAKRLEPPLSSSEIEDKRRLVEIYLIISGLLMSGIQISCVLITASVNYPTNSTIETGIYFKETLPFLNATFVVLIIFILAYYIGLTTRVVSFVKASAYVSLVFSFLIVSLVNIQTELSSGHNNTIELFIIWIILFAISLVALSSPERLKDFLKNGMKISRFSHIEIISKVASLANLVLFVSIAAFLCRRLLRI